MSSDGRTQASMLAMFNELANVGRWRDLPDPDVHQDPGGSPGGIPIMSMLQSFLQGISVFRRKGMD